jgi:HEAT repeat protein
MALSISLRDSSLAVDLFAPLLHDELQTTRFAAAFGLSQHGPEAVDALPALVEALNDPDENVRLMVADAVCAIADDPGRGLDVLIQLLGHENPALRNCAAHGISDLGRKAAPATGALIEAANDPDIWVRLTAIRALGLIGPEASDAIPVLRDLTASDDNTVAAAAQRALEAIETPP